MHMQMRDGFATVLAIVNHDAEAVFQVKRLRHGSSGEQQMAEKRRVFGLRFTNSSDHLFGDHQNMRWRLRVDVVDSNALSVFVFDLSRNFAGDNFFEECASKE